MPEALVLLREVVRRAPFKIHRALLGERQVLVWAVRHPDLHWQPHVAEVRGMIGREIPGVLSLRALEPFRGELRVAVDGPDSERWLAAWLSGNPGRGERLEAARLIAVAVAGLHTAGASHGWLDEESFVVDSQGRPWLADFPARRIAGLGLEGFPSAPPPGLAGGPGKGSGALRDARALGMLVAKVLGGAIPAPGQGSTLLPPRIPAVLASPLRLLLEGEPAEALAAIASLAGRLEAVGLEEEGGDAVARGVVRAVRKWLDPVSRVLLAVAGAWAALEILRLLAFSPAGLRVPDLSGSPLREAIPRLRSLGFDVVEEGMDEPEGFPMGAVSRTEPEAGRAVRRGSTIHLWESPGPDVQVVPDLSGLGVGEATSRLLAAGFWVGSLRVSRSALERPGQVVGSRPSAGEGAGHGTAVDLDISFPLAEKTLAFPDLGGGTVAAALRALESRGISLAGGVRIFRRERPGLDRERVVGQSPEPGDMLPPLWPGDLLLGVEGPPDRAGEWTFDPREVPGWVERGGVDVHLAGGDFAKSWREPWSGGLRQPAFVIALLGVLRSGQRHVVLTIAQGGRVAWSTRFE